MTNEIYTLSAQHVLKDMVRISKELDQDHAGTEHLLLALMRETSSVAGEVLSEAGLEEKRVRDLIDQLISIHSDVALADRGVYSAKVEKVLQGARMEAVAFSSELVGTEHILMSLLRLSDCSACRLLNTLSVSPHRLYSDILTAIGEDPARYKSRIKNLRTPEGDQSSTPLLDKYSRDLTYLASQGKLDPVVGRENEITRVIQILSRRTKNSPCLVGEPGVGKTAIAEGLALRISTGNVPESVLSKRVVSLDLAGMVAGSKYRGEFEERVKKILSEVTAAGNILLFLDEVHTLIGAGGAEGSIDAANMLKPALARGEIQLIGATTIAEYRKYIEKDAALERRFAPVNVDEPTRDEAVEILRGIKHKFEEHHGIEITDEAVIEAVDLSVRYINDRNLPDKAIDVIDEASSRARLTTRKVNKRLMGMSEELKTLYDERRAKLLEGDYKAAGELSDKYFEFKKKYERALKRGDKKEVFKKAQVTQEDVAHVVSVWTGVPVSKITEKENKRLMKLEDILHKRVIGQKEAVSAVARAIKRGRVGLKDPRRPMGSFLFLGPTGVGKTELSKALAEAVFGSEDSLIRVDMSEFMESHSVAKMIGAPPGYVGHDEGGQLAQKVRTKPYSVVLFDEIEKAHPDVFNVLLQVLDDGHITDSKGRKVSFKNTIIIMTSNAGAQRIIDPKKLGFSSDVSAEKNHEDMKRGVMEEVKRIFRPEFLNRIDETIVFHALNDDEMKDIVTLLLSDLIKRAKKNMGLELKVSNSVKKYIIEKGIDRKYGARPLKRAIQSMIEDELASEILSGRFEDATTVSVNLKKDKIVFS
ncbi:MAG: ATP-dependent Clp protease ATP-binding subunit [Lachnospiraceae bacterium]|nr:ATP-dependent Clp protease ATP-binding subunit [Lachnospiraceae bacterium]